MVDKRIIDYDEDSNPLFIVVIDEALNIPIELSSESAGGFHLNRLQGTLKRIFY
jgi:hypothetical protein